MAKINSSFFDSFTSGDDEVEKKLPELEEEEEETEKDKEDEEEQDDDSDSSDASDDDTDKDGKSDEVEDKDFYINLVEDQVAKGILYYDEDKEYEFDNPEEILDEVVKDTLEKRFQEEYLEKIPEEYHSIFEHLKQGKSLTEWVDAVRPTDYSKVDLEDEANQKSLIEEHLALTGMDEDDIKDSLKEFEDAGTLEKNAKKALKVLQKNEEGKAKKYEEELEAEREAIEQAREKQLEDFSKRVLSTEELGKKKLDKKERQSLLDYITKPANKKGESKYVLDMKDETKQLQMAYLSMSGFDFSKLEQEATTKANKGLRAKLSKPTDINGKKTGVTGRETVESKKLGNWNPW